MRKYRFLTLTLCVLATLAFFVYTNAQETPKPTNKVIRRVIVRHADPQLIWKIITGQTTFNTPPEITTKENMPNGNRGNENGRKG